MHPKLNVDIFANSTWDLGVDFIKETTMDKTIIGSYIRSWERPGDLPRVIEILCLFASGAQRKETKISITSERSPGISQQRI